MATAPMDQGLENSTDDFSLADLAGLDVSGIEEVRSEQLPDGAYVFTGDKVGMDEGENKEGEARFVVAITFKVSECHAVLDAGVTKEELVGKNHTERFYIPKADAKDAIGRIRAFVADIGLPNAGPLGGLAGNGAAMGILDQIPGHSFPAKITSRKQNGERYARIKLNPPKK
jgi:hypothetical protein